MLKRLRYFSVAVADLEAAIKTYLDFFGLQQMTSIGETRWGFRATMLGDGQQAWIELVSPSPTNPDSALARFMRERSNPLNPHGEGLYLVGFEVDDLETTVEQIRAAGGRVTTEPQTPSAAWVHPLSANYVLIELQRPRTE